MQTTSSQTKNEVDKEAGYSGAPFVENDGDDDDVYAALVEEMFDLFE